MGYFSNGEENERYQLEYCNKCVHCQDIDIGCPIMAVHWTYNYDQQKKGNKKLKELLEGLIPRDGVFNGKCKMFSEKGN
jgi:hypothetical protein